MMRSGSAEHIHAMVRAAELYYNDGLLQAEIADKLRVSRWKVGRLLEQARATGLVEITIHHPSSRHRDLESQLMERFGCRDAVVIASQASAAATLDLAARAAASYLTEMRPPPNAIALSWGRTVAAIAAALPQGAFEAPTLVQLNGGAPSVDGTVDAASVIRLIASKCEAPVTRLLPTPAIVSDRALAKQLRSDRGVRQTIELARTADTAVFSLGALSPASVLLQSGSISDDEQVALQRAGAVGDILGHYVDQAGRIVDLELDSRTIGVDLGDIASIRNAIAIGVGLDKTDITRAALRSGLCTILVTESSIAESVLASTHVGAPPASTRHRRKDSGL